MGSPLLAGLHSLKNAARSIGMSQYLPQKKKQIAEKGTVPLLLKVQNVLSLIIDFFICVYLVLMIVVMPFYFRDGYSYIATDKAYLCRRINTYAFRVLIPLSTVYLGSSLAAFLWEKRGKLTKAVWLEQLRKLWKKITIPDIFMGWYGVALTISYLCSDYRGDALWGAGNGWYIGFLPQIMLIGAYFFISKFWRPRKSFFWLLFAVSGAVFLLGYLNRFSIYPIKMKMSSPSFISTIGNINWYCGYVVTVLSAGVALVWQGHEGGWKGQREDRRGSWKIWQNVLLYSYVLLGFATLTTQGSTSGIVALAVMLLVMFVMSAENGGRMCHFWVATGLLSAACLFTWVIRSVAPERINLDDKFINLLTTGRLPIIMTVISLFLIALFYIVVHKGMYPQKGMKITVMTIVSLVSCGLVLCVFMLAINTKHPGSLGQLSEYPEFTFSDSWGSHRGTTWKAGIMCFSEQNLLHKLAGVGPDAMAAYLHQDSSERLQEMLNQAFGDLRLTNTHNEWLTVLVNTGILGLVGFGGAMVTAIRTFLGKSGKAASADGSGCPICCACGFSLLAYTVNNIFSFQQTVSLTTMMVILGMGMAFLREESTIE